jgi:Domain of unknown function (DUF4440)
MKTKLTTIAILFALSTTTIFAQSKCQNQVAAAVQQLTKAMIDGDSIMLNKLAATKLGYGHSGGHVDTKAEFVHKLTGGGSDFVTINITQQTIEMFGKTATVRHNLDATTNDNNKPAEVHLKVLLIWQKQKGQWKLIARQAIKLAK